jgi:phospho-N-acetylmuramoyl-pentapeptide-transferase
MRNNPFLTVVVSTVLSAALLPLLINILYRLNFKDFLAKKENKEKDNKVFVQLQGHKVGTPKSGGLVWVIVFPVIAFYLFGDTVLNRILIIPMLLVGLIGLIDDSQKILNFRWDSILRVTKLVFFLLIAAGTSINLMQFNGVFYNLLTLGFLTVVFLSYINAFNINDGLDGLMTGQAVWIFTGMLILTLLKDQNDFAIYYSILLGSLIAFLYFNVHPARVFMGDVGSTTVGALGFTLAVASANLWPFVVMSVPSIIIAASSLIQIFSLKFLNRKVFRIAPLHHHFQAVGWEETKVTQRFWIFQMFCVFLSLAIFS